MRDCPIAAFRRRPACLNQPKSARAEKLILPSLSIRSPHRAPAAKIFHFRFSRNNGFILSSRLDEEGRFAIVTTREAGSGGR
jgi:hypothetical protein